MKHGVDFSLWEQGGTVVMALSGPLDAATVQLLRARLEEMAQPDRAVVLDLLRVPSVDDEAILALLSLQSDLKGKGTEIVLVATSPEVLGKVAPYRQLFSVHPSVQSLLATGFQTKGVRWSRRTGFRMAAPVAAFLALLLAGWMGTLLLVVVWQFRELRQSSAEVELLRARTVREQATIDELEKRLKPLEDLGLLEKPKPRRKKPKSTEPSDSAAPPVEAPPSEAPAEAP
jgi:anti-anti-sigma factor